MTIENPILNSPFAEPDRHFKFDADGITDEVVDGRRVSSYFMPIPKSKRKGGQLVFDEWSGDRIEENTFINQVRTRVQRWRMGGWQGVTPTTRYLLEYWTNEERDKKFFFCQVEALETAIYIAEVAKKQNDPWIDNQLREWSEDSNPGLFRIAHKMATGTGKTVVMAMLICWQALNKAANPQDNRFSDAFLLVAPGITIRDRLRVLLPSSGDNYYRERDIVPSDRMADLGRAKIVIVNFHQFQLRERTKASKLTKQLLSNSSGVFTETRDEMVARVCKPFGSKKNIIVINDEAHHCYTRRQGADAFVDPLTGEEKRDAEEREEEARVWISGLEAIAAKRGIKVCYDLSATPFYLQGSGWPEGTLFQWVVSDFSLIDAIESGLVKIPRVPVDDNSQQSGDLPTYRGLWMKIRDALPKKGRRTEVVTGQPTLPGPLQTAIESLYSNYKKSFGRWEQVAEQTGATPPVFIVVCNNTSVSKMIFDYMAGWEKVLSDGSSVVVPGATELFSNERNGKWSSRPKSILVDSSQLESGAAMTPEFKSAASTEIARFKDELRERFPGRDVDEVTDEDLLREVMNTVGKPGKLGEEVRCVVSVSMLTEGWDANTVTHILGVRAFGTQLLCEQVVGRGLRRRSYVLGDDGRFEPEYAEVYGVPFSFIPASGAQTDPKPGPIPTRVRSLPDRSDLEITFPHVIGYRWNIPEEQVEFDLTEDSHLSLSSRDIPTRTSVTGVVGATEEHRLDTYEQMRRQEVAFRLASQLLDRHFRDEPIDGQPPQQRTWLFPKLLEVVNRWIDECVVLKDDVFIGMLLVNPFLEDAIRKLYESFIRFNAGWATLTATVRPYDPFGSTAFVDFDTTKDVYPASPHHSHVSHVVCDSGWEAAMAEKLEHMSEVRSYVKNHGLGFNIPYVIDGVQRNYIPDFVVRFDDGHGDDDLLNLVIEVSGESKRDKAQKVHTARELWIPAVNNHGGFGRWHFVEVVDPWEAASVIRNSVRHADELSTIGGGN